MVLEFQFTRPSALLRAYSEFEGYCALKESSNNISRFGLFEMSLLCVHEAKQTLG